jgi:hypothetical protein
LLSCLIQLKHVLLGHCVTYSVAADELYSLKEFDADNNGHVSLDEARVSKFKIFEGKFF